MTTSWKFLASISFIWASTTSRRRWAIPGRSNIRRCWTRCHRQWRASTRPARPQGRSRATPSICAGCCKTGFRYISYLCDTALISQRARAVRAEFERGDERCLRPAKSCASASPATAAPARSAGSYIDAHPRMQTVAVCDRTVADPGRDARRCADVEQLGAAAGGGPRRAVRLPVERHRADRRDRGPQTRSARVLREAAGAHGRGRRHVSARSSRLIPSSSSCTASTTATTSRCATP